MLKNHFSSSDIDVHFFGCKSRSWRVSFEAMRSNCSDEEENVDDRDVCGVKLQAAEFEHLLCPFDDDGNENAETTGQKLRKQQRNTLLQREYRNSIEISRAVWCTDAVYIPTSERRNEGQMFAETFEDHLKAKRQRRSDGVVPSAPFEQQRNAAASWSKPNAHANLDAVFSEMNSQAESPNQEQRAFLLLCSDESQGLCRCAPRRSRMECHCVPRAKV